MRPPAGPPDRRGVFGRWCRAALLVPITLSLALPLGTALAGPADGVWSRIAASPDPRKWAGVILDPVRGRLIAIGGYPGPQGDVWAQALSGPPDWTPLHPAGPGPSARFAHSVIYQPGQDRVILFGGFDTAFRNDVWALSLSGTPAWTHLTPAGAPPAARWAHVAIYDAARKRMIVFGGYDGTSSRNDVWELTLGATPTWTQLSPGGTSPGPLTNVAGVYDGTHDQLIVFGGFDTGTQQFKSDTWTLSLAGGGTWSHLSPSGTAPSARRDHSMIFDAARSRVVVFGGETAAPPLRNDAYALTLDPSPSWAQLSPSGPLPTGRAAHRAVYDAAHDRMWVFGGDDGQVLNETWGLSLGSPGAWQPLGVISPTPHPRRNYGMALAGSSIVLYGGDFFGPTDDTWKLKLNASPPAWESVLPPSRPTPRAGHHMIFDPPRDRVLFFGGYDGQFRNDVYEFPLPTGSWQAVLPSGTPPTGREYYGTVYDPVRQRMLVIGGHSSLVDFYNDVWALDLNGPPAWSQLTPAGIGPSARYAHSLIYQPGQDRVILFGGYDGVFRNDVWALSLAGTPTWTQLAPAGVAPAGRWASAVVYDAMRNRMVVFGGWDGFSAHNDAWALSLGATPTWTQLAPTDPPPDPRANIEGAYDPAGDRLIVTAGFDPGTESFYSDTWQLSFGSSPTPALVSLVSARAEPGRAWIEWQVAGSEGAKVTVWRRDNTGAWSALGERVPDGEDRVAFEDRAVVEGARYGYRIGFREGGSDVYAGEVSLEIPRAARLALSGARPNPAGRVLTIGYALEDASPATLELYDTSGRRVFARDVGSEGAGAHEFRVAEAGLWPAGVYVARLSQHGRALVSRVVIIR